MRVQVNSPVAVGPTVANREIAVIGDDGAGAGSPDYHSFVRRTNELTGDVSSYYQVTFLGFSETAATVINNVSLAREGLTVKLLSIVPGVGGKISGPGSIATPQGQLVTPNAAQVGVRAGNPGALAGGARQPGPVAAPTRRLDTVADEKSFRVSMLLEITKPGTAATP